MEKLEWCGYPTVKNFEDMLIRFDRMYERDGNTHTHRQTPHGGRPHLQSIAHSRGKNISFPSEVDMLQFKNENLFA